MDGMGNSEDSGDFWFILEYKSPLSLYEKEQLEPFAKYLLL